KQLRPADNDLEPVAQTSPARAVAQRGSLLATNAEGTRGGAASFALCCNIRKLVPREPTAPPETPVRPDLWVRAKPLLTGRAGGFTEKPGAAWGPRARAACARC